MSPWLLLAAVLVQEEFQALGETEGWHIARAGSSCLMTREFGGDGNTILTLSIDPDLPEDDSGPAAGASASGDAQAFGLSPGPRLRRSSPLPTA